MEIPSAESDFLLPVSIPIKSLWNKIQFLIVPHTAELNALKNNKKKKKTSVRKSFACFGVTLLISYWHDVQISPILCLKSELTSIFLFLNQKQPTHGHIKGISGA